MKALIVLAGLALLVSPALAQTDAAATDSASPTTALDVADAKVSDDTLGNLGTEDAPVDGNWGTLDDTTRFLSIMGTADGFSAGGVNSPCFPGKDNSKLDLELKAAGFDAKHSVDLADALALLSAPADQCAKVPQRGYNSDLLKTMPDAHLAIYLTGAVRGYAKVKTCAPEDHAYAAAAIAAEIFAAKTPTQSPEIISAALASECGQPKE